MIPYTIETDGRDDIPIQCVLDGGKEAGGFQSSDLITAKVRPIASSAVTFSPTCDWYTEPIARKTGTASNK